MVIAVVAVALVIGVMVLLAVVSRKLMPRKPYRYRPRPILAKTANAPNSVDRTTWVSEEIIKTWISLRCPTSQFVAYTFNRRHAKDQVSVCGSFVAALVKKNANRIRKARRKIANRPPKNLPWQLMWAIDFTFKRDSLGNTKSILGIVECYSRACLALEVVSQRSSISILRVILFAVERFGRPEIIRTDNEAGFRSRVFRFGLWVLGIKHDRIDTFCSWQNARVESFFNTLKRKLRLYPESGLNLQRALLTFRFWYNHIRPHARVFGRTPAEAWMGYDVFATGTSGEMDFSAWNGLLQGKYFRPIAPTESSAPPVGGKQAVIKAPGPWVPWSQAEDEVLKRSWCDPWPTLLDKLPGRSRNSICSRLGLFRLSRRGKKIRWKRWSWAELNLLVSLYPMSSLETLLKALRGRNYESIYTKAHELGLHRARSVRGEKKVKVVKTVGVTESDEELGLPTDLRFAKTYQRAQDFFDSINNECLEMGWSLATKIVLGYPTLIITSGQASMTFVFASFVLDQAGAAYAIRPVKYPSFRINGGRVKVNAITVLGMPPELMTSEDWKYSVGHRAIPLLKALAGEDALERVGPCRKAPGGSNLVDRMRIATPEFSSADIEQLVTRIRAVSSHAGGGYPRRSGRDQKVHGPGSPNSVSQLALPGS